MKIFIKSKKDYKKFFDYEKKLYGQKKRILFRPVIKEKNIIWKYVCILRKCELYQNTKKRIRYFIFKLLKGKMRIKTGFSIPNNTCDLGLRINHLGIIHLSADCVGKNCTIAGSCYAIKNGFKEGNPIIGDNVFIGMNAILIGPVRIADNCLIGAGSVVTKSFINQNMAIAGNPAREIKRIGLQDSVN